MTPINHPAFWTIEAQPGDDATPAGFAGAVMTRGLGASSHREWAHTEIVVDEGYESPYRFGRLLRQLVGDDNAIIFRYTHSTGSGQAPTRIYFTLSNHTGRAAFYDPAKRQPGEGTEL